MIVLYVLLGMVAFYLLCGVLVLWASLYYMVGTQDEYPKHADNVRMYKEASPKAKAHMWACAIWYGMFCWLPIACGWMVRPSEFLNARKK